MSWVLVIPFDVIKTIVQAEVDSSKHGNMIEMFKTKTRVSLHPTPTYSISKQSLGIEMIILLCYLSLEIWMESVLPGQLDHFGTIVANKCRHIFR